MPSMHFILQRHNSVVKEGFRGFTGQKKGLLSQLNHRFQRRLRSDWLGFGQENFNGDVRS